LLSSNIWLYTRHVNTSTGKLRRCVSFAFFLRRWSASRYLRFERRGNTTKVRDVWHGHLRMGYGFILSDRARMVATAFPFLHAVCHFISRFFFAHGGSGGQDGRLRRLFCGCGPLSEETPTVVKDGGLGSSKPARATSAVFTLEVGRRETIALGAGLTCYFFGLWRFL